MEENCKATINVGEARIVVEGPADFVQAQVEKYAGTQSGIGIVPDSKIGGTPSAMASGEKQLIREKRPHGHHEIVTVLAFALTERGAKEFTEDDVRRAYIRAEVRPPKYVAQALRDAKSKYDYIATGSKRGVYRLTSHGDRTVRFDLPRTGR